MIGHFLWTLTEDQEDRVLMGRMEPGGYFVSDMSGCLVGIACGDWVERHVGGCESRRWPPMEIRFSDGFTGPVLSVTKSYDNLCKRFSTSRINAAIRARILENRARRILGNAVECVGAGPTTETPQP